VVQKTFVLAGALALLAGGASAQTSESKLQSPPAMGIAVAAPPQARIETSLGSFTITLDRSNAPKSVANFIAYAREGHYDGTIIYRVAPGFVIQMGSFEASGTARPTHAPIALESANGLKNVRGTVAMARQADPASATAEFFVNLTDNPDLDPKPDAAANAGGYAVFGRVSGGMDVVDKIAAVPLGGEGPFPPSATPATPVVIRKVTIAETASPNPPPYAK
jgi:cyclophilin family peptidyl-prolyl cis-trans isomerase